MVFEPLEVGCRVLTKDFSDFVFIRVRAPEVTDVSGLTLSHIVQSVIQSLLFCHKPFVHFKRTDFFRMSTGIRFISMTNLVDLSQISSKVFLGSLS